MERRRVDTISPLPCRCIAAPALPDPYLATRVDKQIFTFSQSSYARENVGKIVVTDNGATDVYRAFLYGLTVGIPPNAGPAIFLLLD